MESVSPGKALIVLDAIFVTVGVVIGACIFRTRSVVAANAGSEHIIIILWFARGIISLIGGHCYAEHASAYPSMGGN